MLGVPGDHLHHTGPVWRNTAISKASTAKSVDTQPAYGAGAFRQMTATHKRMKAANITSQVALGMPPAANSCMETISQDLVAKEVLSQNSNVEQVSFEALHDQYTSDLSPNKGSEEDYLERKLASGWRKSPDGKGIWCISNPIVSNVPATNTPDPSLFKNPGPPQHDNNGTPQEIAENKDDLRPKAQKAR